MADAGFFKGTSADQDRRFSDKELKLLKTMKFPPEFEKKVDMRKVNLSVIRPWIVKKVVELVGFEDEVVVEYAMGLLEDDSQPTPDPRRMQINLTGFLTNNTPAFMSALWKLLLEAQESPAGVPRTFVEEKKEEMRQAKAGDTRALEERDRRARLDEIPTWWPASAPFAFPFASSAFPASKEAPIPFPLVQSPELAFSIALSHSTKASLPLASSRWPLSLPFPSTPQTLTPTSFAVQISLSSSPNKTSSALALCFPTSPTRQKATRLAQSAPAQTPHLPWATLAFALSVT
ncbi:PWI domain-containing protein [Trametes coccinea BRFM310]|uniref:PWI domain-containing protein n=1 Tax=Trametes coccinea (strain BRFM310) TaxID=1353009 RepID=A0A1Y2IWX4_TRAC3|nr:PWI domain-containing protein [Trametes coccinea BRFM310]